MHKIITISLLGVALLQAQCKNYVNYQIATGSTTGTYYQIGKNLSKYVAPSACIKLEVLSTKGSLDNVYKLRSVKFPKLKFAIVQNDVLQELKKFANKGNKKAKDLLDNIRVLLPLYNEEIHILSRASSNIKTFGDLKDKKLSIGKNKSGTAMTSFLLYKELFNQDLKKFKNEGFNDALYSLEHNNTDAIVLVSGQPVPRLEKMPKSAGKFLRLLSYDEKNTNHNPITSYYTTEIKKSSYKWIDNNTPTLSTKSYLITFNYKNLTERKYITNFVKSIKANLPMLREKATDNPNTPHLKWKQVDDICNLTKLPGGWEYYNIVNNVCGATKVQMSEKKLSTCSEYEKSVGLCE